MTPDLERDDPSDDDSPTARFTLQRCPHCEGMTAVALCFAMARCSVCEGIFEVAPLIAATMGRDSP
jgi:hypothetical protein